MLWRLRKEQARIRHHRTRAGWFRRQAERKGRQRSGWLRWRWGCYRGRTCGERLAINVAASGTSRSRPGSVHGRRIIVRCWSWCRCGCVDAESRGGPLARVCIPRTAGTRTVAVIGRKLLLRLLMNRDASLRVGRGVGMGGVVGIVTSTGSSAAGIGAGTGERSCRSSHNSEQWHG